jgi:hypothetical protein
MNTPDTWLWASALLALSAALLALPFWPAWAEWRRPRDRSPLPIPEAAPPAQDPHAPLMLANGEHFETVQSNPIVLGEGVLNAVPALPALQRWQPPPSARPWGTQGWHIPHDLHIPAGQHVPCSLVVRGRCVLQGPGWLQGDIKTRDGLRLGAGYRVQGSLFSEGDIRLDSGSQVSGVVLAEGRLQLAPQVVIGTPQQPVSVCADVIDVRGPAQVHGTLQARVRGQVAANPSPLSPPHKSP